VIETGGTGILPVRRACGQNARTTNSASNKKTSGGLAAAAFISHHLLTSPLNLAEQTEHGLGLCVGDAQGLGRSLAENLTAGQVGGFDREVGVADD
jgi:hypothetical protein